MSNRPRMRTVQLAESTVTMASVGELRAEARGLEQEAEAIVATAAKLRADAEARFVEAGMILVGRPTEWSAGHRKATIPLANAVRMIKAIDDSAEAAGTAKRGGLGGLFGRNTARVETREERLDREERGSQLRAVLAELGRAFGTALPAVAQVHGKAVYMDDRAATTQAKADELLARAHALKQEAD